LSPLFHNAIFFTVRDISQHDRIIILEMTILHRARTVELVNTHLAYLTRFRDCPVSIPAGVRFLSRSFVALLRSD